MIFDTLDGLDDTTVTECDLRWLTVVLELWQLLHLSHANSIPHFTGLYKSMNRTTIDPMKHRQARPMNGEPAVPPISTPIP